MSWIKIHRDLNKHWIWNNPEYLKWWLDILIEVNFEPQKILINNKIYECNRGEKLYSLDTWAKRWNTNKSKVRRFLDLLQKENMITLKSETQTTRISVCKYDSYQDLRNESETQVKRKRNASETQVTPIKERKELKKEKNINNNIFSFKNSLISLGAEEQLINDWLAVRKNKKATNTETAFNLFKSEVEKSKADVNEVLKLCIEKSWSGFKSEWKNNFEKSSKNISPVRMF